MSLYRSKMGPTASTADLEARLQAATSATSESLTSVASQIDSLRRGYSTLSQVFVEEIDAVRSECSTLRAQLSGRVKEIDALNESFSKATRNHQDLANEVSQQRRYLKKVKHHSEKNGQELEKIQPNVDDMLSRISFLEKDQRELWRTVNSHASTLDTVQSELSQTRHDLREMEARFQSTLDNHSKKIQNASDHSSDLDQGFQMFWKRFEESQKRIGALAEDVSAVTKDSTQNFQQVETEVSKLRSRTEDLEADTWRNYKRLQGDVNKLMSEVQQQIDDRMRWLTDMVNNLRQDHDVLRGELQKNFNNTQTYLGKLNGATKSQSATTDSKISKVERNVSSQVIDLQHQIAAVARAVENFSEMMKVPVSPSVRKARESAYKSGSITSTLNNGLNASPRGSTSSAIVHNNERLSPGSYSSSTKQTRRRYEPRQLPDEADVGLYNGQKSCITSRGPTLHSDSVYPKSDLHVSASMEAHTHSRAGTFSENNPFPDLGTSRVVLPPSEHNQNPQPTNYVAESKRNDCNHTRLWDHNNQQVQSTNGEDATYEMGGNKITLETLAS